jgi:hypothetical protein
MARMTPNGFKGWLGLAWPILQTATPVTMLLMGLTFAAVIWYCLGEQRRMQATSLRFFDALQVEQKAHLQAVMDCYTRQVPRVDPREP